MLMKIAIVVALCSGVKLDTVQSRLAEVRAKYPDAQVSFRVDNKARCYKGQVLTGREAKVMEQLETGKAE